MPGGNNNPKGKGGLGERKIDHTAPFWNDHGSMEEAFQLMVNQICAYLRRPHLDQTFRLRLFRVISGWKVTGDDAKNDLKELKLLLQDVRKVA